MYPLLEVHIDRIRENIHYVSHLLKNQSIEMTGVIKGCASLKKVAEVYMACDCRSLGSSRIKQLKKIKSFTSTQTMLLRLPMLDEIKEVIAYADVSLNSEMTVLKALNKEAIKQDKVHHVILMLDVGDLREGFWKESNLIDAAMFVESAEGLYLKGVGSNLSCYGSVKPTVKNMKYLVYEAEQIEKVINRTLDVISGGATSTMPMVVKGELPNRINHLRLGESILLGRDLEVYYDCPLPLHEDTFILTAQLIEIKNKPSLPIGEKVVDAFGNKPVYIDQGYHKRGILAIGKQDFGNHEKLIPRDPCIKIIGSSSDHLIVDLTTADYKLGDTISFEMFYQPLLFLTLSDEVTKIYMEKS